MIKICETCGNEYFPKTSTQRTCSKECKKTLSFKEKRRLKNDQFKRQEKEKRKKAFAEWTQTNTIKMAIFRDMEKEGGIYCEECGRRGNYTKIEEHHIIFRSELPRHPKRHCRENVLILCEACHRKFHEHKKIRDKWIIKRRLWEVFPEVIKKEKYI